MHGGNPERIAREYGVDPAYLTDFSTGINPLGFPSYVRKVVNSALSETSSYPDPEYRDFRIAAGRVTGLPPDHILPGNGTSELLPALLRSLKPPRVILPVPCYIDYEVYSRRIGLQVEHVFLKPEGGFLLSSEDLDAVLVNAPAGSLVILGNPNNPTGRLLPENLVNNFAKRYPDHFFCIDEAYKGFSRAALTPSPFGENIMILRSLTKLYGIPGFRLGYMTADPGLLIRIERELPCWNLGTLASRLAETVFADEEYGPLSRKLLREAQTGFVEGLQALRDIIVYPSDANFLLFRLSGRNPGDFYAKMIHEGILLRGCDDFRGLEEGFFRTAIRLEEDNNKLLDAMDRVLGISS